LNILAIDTTGSECCVGIARQDGLHFLQTKSSAQSHSRCILATIDALLRDAALSLSDLQLLVWNAGPGSFTGIRIAASVVQSLSYSLQIPFLSVSALEALAFASARTLDESNQERHIKVAVDARMNGIYWASFFYSSSGELKRIEGDHLISLEVFAAQSEQMESGTVYAGDAWLTTGKKTHINAAIGDLIALAQTKPQQAWQYRAEECLPNYVQSSINWQKRARYQTP
jgi:tRNA threonylcarbamoyladenosine biosynthesis protein TsaB